MLSKISHKSYSSSGPHSTKSFISQALNRLLPRTLSRLNAVSPAILKLLSLGHGQTGHPERTTNRRDGNGREALRRLVLVWPITEVDTHVNLLVPRHSFRCVSVWLGFVHGRPAGQRSSVVVLGGCLHASSPNMVELSQRKPQLAHAVRSNASVLLGGLKHRPK
jgi:hypothetical protein